MDKHSRGLDTGCLLNQSLSIGQVADPRTWYGEVFRENIFSEGRMMFAQISVVKKALQLVWSSHFSC